MHFSMHAILAGVLLGEWPVSRRFNVTRSPTKDGATIPDFIKRIKLLSEACKCKDVNVAKFTVT